MKIDQQKKELRLSSIAKRKNLNKNHNKASYKLIENISKIKKLKKIKIIASFISINTEISTEPLNNYLISLGKKICLPVMQKNYDLIFRLFDKKNNLKKGMFGILEPNENCQLLLPELILTPCLAFDKSGHRLGYGGGYYDRTFKKYNNIGHSFISVSVAFDGQRVKNVVNDKNDQRTDYILTEKKIYIANENFVYR